MARGRGSFGGGGRSFGGGGGRSFGGRSGGGFQRGGMRSRPMGGGMGRTPIYRPRRMHIHHRPMFGWGRPYWGRHGCMPGCGSGCSSVFGLLIVLVIGIIIIFATVFSHGGGNVSYGGSNNNNSAAGITKSTIKRTPLPRGSVVETGYYTDELNWIGNPTKLTAGMRNFYQRTGVQPYLYITGTINGSHTPSVAEMNTFLDTTYDRLFSDEAHLLLLFFEYEGNPYQTRYVCGVQAKTVLDSEAMDILLDYIDKYYYYDNLKDEEFFSKAFDDAGKSIMEVTKSSWISVWLVVGAVTALIILFIWWQKMKQQKGLDAERDEQIFNTPMDVFENQDDDIIPMN